MHFSPLLGPTFALPIIATLAAPLSPTPMGSKHTLYLSSCTNYNIIPICPIPILCDKETANSAKATPYTAATYFASGRPPSNYPTEVAVVSATPQAWEGTQRVAKFRSGDFSSVIDAGAKALKKGDVAGSARMGNEEFACFKDGETSFTVDAVNACKADYWCASLEV
jgi:hypothetical protein